MPAQPSDPRLPYQYAILRVVPSVERGEQINVGVVLFCRQRRFLGVRWQLDRGRLAALPAPDGLADAVGVHLAALARVADGDPAAGPVAALEQSDRFGWLTAPSSTVVQASDVHTGLSGDPAATLEALFARLVAAPSNA